MHVGIVTFEFPGLTKNGGIGTAYGRLAENLLKAGHKVTVLFVNIISEPLANDVRKQPLRKKYPKTFRLGLLDVRKNNAAIFSEHNPWPILRSLLVANEIKRLNWVPDILHFHDCLGLAWVTLNWQKYAGFLPKTKIILGMHGPNFWVRDAHGILAKDFQEYTESNLEKSSFELAPFVISPSQYMLNYLKAKNWRREESFTRVIPNMNNSSLLAKKKKIHGKANHIIFFGRLEPRKGIFLFVESLKLLSHKISSNRPLKVTFLGRNTKLPNDQLATDFVRSQLKYFSKKFHLQFFIELDTLGCNEYFKKHPSALVVLPSLADNSPYVLVECLEMGLNFICTNNGGQSELLDVGSVDSTCVDPSAEALTNKICEYLSKKHFELPQPAKQVVSANNDWLKVHSEIFKTKKLFSFPNKASQLDVDIFIRSQGDLLALNRTLRSIESSGVKPQQIVVTFNTSQLGINQGGTLLLIRKIKEYYEHMPCKFQVLAGGWNDEMMQACLQSSKSKFIFPIMEGDEVSEDIQNILRKATFNRSESDLCILFGMNLNGKVQMPGPISLETHLYFDFVSKFPMLFDRNLFFSKQDHDDKTISNTFGLKTSLLLERLLRSEQVFSIPVSILTSRTREPFYPYWPCWKDEFLVRLDTVNKNLKMEEVQLIEHAYNILNLGRHAQT